MGKIKKKHSVDINEKMSLAFWSEDNQEWIKFTGDFPNNFSKIKILTERYQNFNSNFCYFYRNLKDHARARKGEI
jgi:hypothetical protein